MLDAIYQIGKYQAQKQGLSPLDLWIEDPLTGREDAKVVVVNIEDKKFKDITAGEDYDSNKIKLYLYKRRIGSNGTDFSPTTRLNKYTDFFKSLVGEKKGKGFLGKFILDFPEFSWLFEILHKNRRQIEEVLKEFLEQRTKNKNNLITLKIDGKYVGEIPAFYEYFEKLLRDRFNKKATEGICAICGKKTLVSPEGIPNTMTFYNQDKPGSIPSGMDAKFAIKSVKVCFNCSSHLNYGWNYANNNLLFSLAGLRYILLAKSPIDNENAINELFLSIDNIGRRIYTQNELKENINEEEIVSELVTDLKDSLILFFLFLSNSNSAIFIDKIIENILPSRLKELYKKMQKTDSFLTTFDMQLNEKFTLQFIKDFSNISTDGKVNKQIFLNLMDNIFKGEKLSCSILMQRIIDKVRYMYKKQYNFKQTSLKGYAVLLYLYNLNQLTIKNIKSLYNFNLFSMDNSKKIAGFLRKLPLIDAPQIKAVFLLGALTEKLLNIQYMQRQSKPFRKNLKDLAMSQFDFMALVPRIRNKLEEYDSHGKNIKRLEKLIAKYFLESPKYWPNSKSELNFFFTLGMSLSDKIFKLLKNDINN